MSGESLEHTVRPGTDEIRWSIRVVDAATDEPLIDDAGGTVLRTASVGKVVLLVEVARRLEAGEWEPGTLLARSDVDVVADSGLWQYLHAEALPVADVAALVGAVSDNLATNVLVHHVGLDAVAAVGAAAGLASVRLHDVVRDRRGPEHAETLSTASSADLASLFARLHRGDVISPTVSRQVLDWLAAGSDLSMAASAFDLDPLAHVTADRGVVLRNKTGTDTGVRADAGVVTRAGRSVAYAVVANWDGDREELRGPVMRRMREVGAEIARSLGV